MPFPEAPRVIYKKNVLAEVIFQLRFPTILRIDTELPSAFQEIIRDEFPMYQETDEGAGLQFPESISQLMPRDFLDTFTVRGNRKFQFLSSDHNWTVSLTREFVSLVTTEYTSWEQFREKMQFVVQALIDVYAPAFITRIGLRYQNVIDRNALNLKDRLWKELVARYVLGPLAEDTVATNIAGHHNIIVFRLSDDSEFARLEHGFVYKRDSKPSDYHYLLDNDLYSEKKAQANAGYLTEKLDYFNAVNRRLFNWCITDVLRTAMEPSSSDY